MRAWAEAARLAVAVLLLALVAISASARADQQPVELRTEEVAVVTATGRHVFVTEIADTPDTRSRGLMFRRHLAPDRAMLFDWGGMVVASMWMQNTYIPLDMVFIGADGRVVHIARQTTPGSLDVVTAGRPVRAVLEIAGGLAARIGLAPGDRVEHRLFAP